MHLPFDGATADVSPSLLSTSADSAKVTYVEEKIGSRSIQFTGMDNPARVVVPSNERMVHRCFNRKLLAAGGQFKWKGFSSQLYAGRLVFLVWNA